LFSPENIFHILTGEFFHELFWLNEFGMMRHGSGPIGRHALVKKIKFIIKQ
jgi:hypothetical protein